ncbi:MAG: hypothetical protein J2O47_07485, partial [Acidimicrobiaceae bacterium]|nr:hypothetical protein [Acidimicrobiaceae bacterium]
MVDTRQPQDLRTDTTGGENFLEECRRVWRDPHLPFRHALILVGALAVAVSVGLRFYCPSALWLDETISVNIAKLPLIQIPTALSHDGAPPLYYVLLHFWMMVFGRGDVAARALS